MSIRDKVIVITGARVVAADIADCAETLELVKAAGGEGTSAKLDVADIDSATSMAKATITAFRAH